LNKEFLSARYYEDEDEDENKKIEKKQKNKVFIYLFFFGILNMKRKLSRLKNFRKCLNRILF